MKVSLLISFKLVLGVKMLSALGALRWWIIYFFASLFLLSR